jgi:hypothetical protein
LIGNLLIRISFLNIPVEPGGHWQIKLPPLLMQRPCPHGFGLHASTIFSHLLKEIKKNYLKILLRNYNISLYEANLAPV